MSTSQTTSSNGAESGDAPAAGPMHAAIDHAAGIAGAAADCLQSGAAAAADVFTQAVEGASELADEWAESARASVRARPLTAVFASFAAGLLVGRLCR